MRVNVVNDVVADVHNLQIWQVLESILPPRRVLGMRQRGMQMKSDRVSQRRRRERKDATVGIGNEGRRNEKDEQCPNVA